MKKNLLTAISTFLAIIALAACGSGSDETSNTGSQTGEVTVAEQRVDTNQPAADNENNNNDQQNRPRGGFGFESKYLTTNYEGAASPNIQLILGTLQLEGTDQAITAEQAKKLLPFWIALQSGAVTNQAESNAVLKQIEASMGEGQMQAIAALKLTNQSMGEWTNANGIEMPQGGGPGGPGGPRGLGGADGPLADMTEEELAKFREEMQGLSQEERQERFAELGIEAGGGRGQGGQGQGGQGQGRQGQGRQGGGGPDGQVSRTGLLIQPLIELLTERSSG